MSTAKAKVAAAPVKKAEAPAPKKVEPEPKKVVEPEEPSFDRARIEALKEAFSIGGNPGGPYLDPLATNAEKQQALSELNGH
jgi:hypothetical protein